jgi:hypothetical protein
MTGDAPLAERSLSRSGGAGAGHAAAAGVGNIR